MRRTLLKHAFVILIVAFALGLAAGVTSSNHDPHARLWLSSHVTGLLVSLMIGLVAVAWPELDLGRRAASVLAFVTIWPNYLALAALGIMAPAVGVSPAISGPKLPPPPAWASGVVNATLVIVTVSSFVMGGLVLYGLRGAGRRT
jgi:hypothetical protein